MDPETRQLLRDLRERIDELASALQGLTKALEQDDRLRERAAIAAEQERDKRHSEIRASFQDLVDRVEGIGAAHRGLPDRLVDAVEKKIYELPIARWEAIKAGVANEPAPLGAASTGREPTGRIAVAVAPVDDLALTPQQQRGLVAVLGRVWRWSRWALLPGAGAAAKWLHDLILHGTK